MSVGRRDRLPDGGCGDRNACPEGAAYRYPAAAQAFHMASFIELSAR